MCTGMQSPKQRPCIPSPSSVLSKMSQVMASLSLWNFPGCPPTHLRGGRRVKAPAVPLHPSMGKNGSCSCRSVCWRSVRVLGFPCALNPKLPDGYPPPPGVPPQPCSGYGSQLHGREFAPRPNSAFVPLTDGHWAVRRKQRGSPALGMGHQRGLGVRVTQEQVWEGTLVFMVLHWVPCFFPAFSSSSKLKEITGW